MQSLVDLLAVTLLIAGGTAISVVYYRSLSEPDPMGGRVRKAIRRREWPPVIRVAAVVAFEIVRAVVLVLFWVSVLDVTLFFLLPLERVGDVVLLPFAIVGAARILTFVTPSAARELAKTIPLALIVLLLIGEPLTGDTIVAKARLLEERTPDDPGFMSAVVILELVLRGLLAARTRRLPADRAMPTAHPGRWTVTKRP